MFSPCHVTTFTFLVHIFVTLDMYVYYADKFLFFIDGVDDASSCGGNDSMAAMASKVQSLEAEIKSFGQKRAYFMEIYKKKEGKLAIE